MKHRIAILFASIILLRCHKDAPIVVDGTLTTCPVNSTCTYNYYDSADFGGNQPKQGNYRVFWYKSTNKNLCDATSDLYFKMSLSSNNFVIDTRQIAGGQMVGYNFSCMCCDYVPLKPIGGEIKGKKVDANHWVINATVILANSQNKPLDTIKVNQYFTLTSLP
jgi:hypothetical protein